MYVIILLVSMPLIVRKYQTFNINVNATTVGHLFGDHLVLKSVQPEELPLNRRIYTVY